MNVRFAAVAAAMALTLGMTPGGAAAPQALPRELCQRLDPVAGASVPLCSHGPDPVPAVASATSSSMAATPSCLDGGSGGNRIEVIYGVPKDRPNRYAEQLPKILSLVAQVQQGLEASDTATTQQYRWLCADGVNVTVRNVTLAAVGGDGVFTFSDYVSSLSNQVASGLGSVDYASGNRIYLAFVDQITNAYPYGGQGTVHSDDRPDPAVNSNNGADPKYSMTAYLDARVAAHELEHNIGAVQHSAPHASRAYHCSDQRDLMCYNDAGPYFAAGGVLTSPCPHVSDVFVDCGKDDYYHPGSPPPGSYLATHWNTADSSYLTRYSANDGCTLKGTAGNDVLRGTTGDDVVCGLEGDDVLFGMGGDDRIVGGPGRDEVDYGHATQSMTVSLAAGTASGEGSDTLAGIESVDGSAYADTLTGNAGGNLLAGKGGNDTVYGGAGPDTVYGDLGNDTVYGGAGGDTVYGGAGDDLLRGGDGNDVLRGAAGADRVLGDLHDDTVAGDAGNDTVRGGDGADRLQGGSEDDLLYGDPGDDALNGGLGADACDGGLGIDSWSGCETTSNFP